MAASPATIVSSYRSLYKAALAAVQHSAPARYAVRDKLRKAFRSAPPSHFSQERISNTVDFLQTAAARKGLEHDIVRNLCLVHYWQQSSKKRGPTPQRMETAEKAYVAYYETIALLNQSMDLELR